MSTEKKIPSITEDIPLSDKDLGQQNTEKTTIEDKPEQSNPTAFQQILEKHGSQHPLVHDNEDPTTLKSCMEQEVPMEIASSEIYPVPTNEGKVDNPSASKLFQGQDPVKTQEKFQVPSTSSAANENYEDELTSKLTGMNIQSLEDGKQTENLPEDSKKQVDDGNEIDLKRSEEVKDLQIGGEIDLKQTVTIKRENGNSTEHLEDVKKQESRRWFRFTRSSKEVKSLKNDEPNTSTPIKTEDKIYDIRHVNVCGSYLLAIGLMFVCVAIILGGFFWRIGIAIGGYYEDNNANVTACPTLNPVSNDSNTANTAVLKVLQKIWRTENDELVSD